MAVHPGEHCGPWASGFESLYLLPVYKKIKRKVQGVPQSQTAALPRHP